MRGISWTAGLLVFVFVIALFGAWSVVLSHTVARERAAVEMRVGWLGAMNALEQEILREPFDPESYGKRADAVQRATNEMEAEFDAPSLIRLRALRESLDAQTPEGRSEILERMAALVRLVRGQNGALSAALGERWDTMRSLLFSSLALSCVSVALLAATARSRLQLDTLREDLESEIGRQLTERERMDAMLRHNDRLASIGTLAAGVAHEINNPLTYVLSSLEHAEVLGRSNPGDLREMLSLVSDAREGASRIAAVVRDLGTFARPQDGPAGPVPLVNVVASALAITSLQLRGRARVSTDIAADLAVLAVDGQLVQVFVNLLVNASAALGVLPPASGHEHEIRISAVREGDQVSICVVDTGVGIPEDLLPRVFDPFFTTKGSGQGSGLGLFLCHRIVTRFDGTIRIESRPGRTAVHIRLPYAQMAEPEPEMAEPEPDTSLRVLIIDDEALVARSLARLLRKHTVTAVHSVPEALAHLEQSPVDLIFCDLTLPDVPGRVFVEAVRAQHPALLSRIVLMTGGAVADADRTLFNELGLEPLRKPFDPQAIRARTAQLTALAGP